MEPDLTIPAFLEVIKTNPELFSPQDLEDLDQTLDALENQPIDAVTTGIQNWYKQRPKIRDQVRFRKASFREITHVPPRKQTEDDRTIENRYRELRELQQTVDKLKDQPPESQPIKSDGKHES